MKTKLQKLAEATKKGEEKEQRIIDRKANTWIKASCRLVNRKIKQATRNGETYISIDSNDFYDAVSYNRIARVINFEYVMEKVVEKYAAQGLYARYTDGAPGWFNGSLKVGWGDEELNLKKYKEDCVKYIMKNYPKEKLETFHKYVERDNRWDKRYTYAIEKGKNFEEFVHSYLGNPHTTED